MNKKSKNYVSKQKKQVLKGVAKAILTIDANSASCILMNQPEAPEDLKKYRIGHKDVNE
jgi:cyclic lactone autoinducer peptide